MSAGSGFLAITIEKTSSSAYQFHDIRIVGIMAIWPTGIISGNPGRLKTSQRV